MREGFSPTTAPPSEWSKGTLKIKTSPSTATSRGAGRSDQPRRPEVVDSDGRAARPASGGPIDIEDRRSPGTTRAAAARRSTTGRGAITIVRSEDHRQPGPDGRRPEFVPDPTNPHEPIPRPRPGGLRARSSAIENQASSTPSERSRSSTLIARNTAEQDGAGVKNPGSGTIILERTDVMDNVTNGGNGGGVFSAGGTLTITGGTSPTTSRRRGRRGRDRGRAQQGRAPRHGHDHRDDRQREPLGRRRRRHRDGRRQQDHLHESPSRTTSPPTPAAGSRPKAGRASSGRGDGGGTTRRRGRRHLPREREAVDPQPAERPEQRGRDQGPARHHHDRRAPGQGYVPGSNTAGGGGMYTEGGPVEIDGGEFTGNIATEEGGGISLGTELAVPKSMLMPPPSSDAISRRSRRR